MVVYDITDKSSFVAVDYWMEKISESGNKGMVGFLVGNKCDLADSREVTREEGEELAARYKVPFFEVSAKLDINIEEAFFKFVNIVLDQLEKTASGINFDELSPPLTISPTPISKPEDGGCC